MFLFFPGKAVSQVGGANREAPGHYFLVVDHSGSMLQAIRSGPDEGRTRWDLMRDRAASFIERLPEGSTAWVGVFSALEQSDYQKVSGMEPLPLDGWLTPLSADLADQRQRERLTSQIRTFAEPAVANGTWLYQATAKALDRVEQAGARDPDAYMTVLVYTDGVDEGHGRTRAEMLQNPSSPIAKTTLEARIRQLKDRHRNLNIINVYSPGDESIHDAHVVRLLTNRIQLPSPLIAPQQDIEIGIRFRDDATIQLAGRPFSFKWEADPGAQPPPLRVEGGPFRMADGTTKVKLVTTADWPAARDISARLKLVYPKIENTFLVEEGGSTVEIFFQGAEAPSIRDLIPADGSAFPVGREIGFSLTTLPGCEVDWAFDDGTTVRGNPVTRDFDAPGTRTVNVKVTDPRTGLSGTTTTSITLTELEVSLDPLPGDVVPGVEIALTASALGDFRSFDWQVGGRSYVGAPRPDGRPGSILQVSFDRSGDVPIRVVGRGSAGGIAEAEPAVLQVKTVPALRVPSPSAGESLYFGTRRELRAELEGVDANQIRFLLMAGGEELLSRDVDVRTEGPLRIAVLPIDVPTLSVRSGARLVVSTLGVETALTREIDLVLESEPASITIIMPEGREPHINKETPVQLESNSAIANIRWYFGDGWVDGNTVMRHVWNNYGSFQVEAKAVGPDGSEVVAVPVDVTVPVRAVIPKATIVSAGKEVGAEVDKVPVGATVSLRSASAGDIVSEQWLLDGTPLGQGVRSVTIDEMRNYQLVYRVTGTVESGGDKELVFHFGTSNRPVFYGIVAVLLLINLILARLALGNGPRRWKITVVSFDEYSKASHAGYQRLLDLGRWNWWKKRVRLAMSGLDKGRGWRDRAIEISGGRAPLVRKCWGKTGSEHLLREEVPDIGYKFKTLVRASPREGESAHAGIFIDTTTRSRDLKATCLKVLFVLTLLLSLWTAYAAYFRYF